MLVRPPVGEPRQIIEDGLAVRMEDVGSVLVDQHAGRVVPVVGVAANVGTPVDEQYLVLTLTRQPLGDNTAGEPGANHEPIIHVGLPLWRARRRSGATEAGRTSVPICGRVSPRSVRPFATKFGPTTFPPANDRSDRASWASVRRATAPPRIRR